MSASIVSPSWWALHSLKGICLSSQGKHFYGTLCAAALGKQTGMANAKEDNPGRAYACGDKVSSSLGK